jgi:uncharacterized protein (TIGR02594 family)
MILLPTQYQWLSKEPGPKILLEAIKLFGTKEMPGDGDSPEILLWAKETGLNRVYSHDIIPWCGLFMALITQRSGNKFPENPLWALNWLKFGVLVSSAMLGDVLVFKRPTGGHVALYIGETGDCYYTLGGNQSDSVCISKILKSRCVGIRRPVYQILPANIRKILLSDTGSISTNEA